MFRHWAMLAVVVVGFTSSIRADDAASTDSPQPAPGIQVGQTTKLVADSEDPVDTVRYLLFLPAEYETKSKEKWPLILFLHGAGERGTDLNLVKVHGPPKIVEKKKDFPFVVVSPQAPAGGDWMPAWKPERLMALVDHVAKQYRVDQDRIYVTGLSMGGYGTWRLAAAFPNRFAAAVPICGGGKPESAEQLKSLPIWVFHGAKDSAVSLAKSEEMIDALKKAGGSPKFTVYPDAGHDSWTATYDNPELYQWLLSQKRKSSE